MGTIVMPYKIMLADEDHQFCLDLKERLDVYPEFLVVGKVGDIMHLPFETTRLQPDIVVIDLPVRGFAGLSMVERIKRSWHYARVIFLTSARTDECVRAALFAGIDGYVLKDSSFDELLMALNSVAAGKKYLSPDISNYVVQSCIHNPADQGKRKCIEYITSQERDVMQLIAEGRSSRSAAEVLCVSSRTVERHRSSLMRKLELRKASELIAAAAEMGLI